MLPVQMLRRILNQDGQRGSQDPRKHLRNRVSPVGPTLRTQSNHWNDCPPTVSAALADSPPRNSLRRTWPSHHQTIQAKAHCKNVSRELREISGVIKSPHMFCPRCGEQYPDNVNQCSVCHVDLVPFYEQIRSVPNPDYFNKNSPAEIVDLLKAIYDSAVSWVTGVKMRRKISTDLGRKATDDDLTSLDTWMEVDEAEKKRNKAS